MDIRQLRYFIALAEERQVTSAALKLHMSQPPLSQQLKLMETELGVQLFHRNGRQLELTAPGRTLFEHALTITRLMDEAKAETRESGLGIRGKLSIGVNTLSDSRLPGALSLFREKYPKVTFKIQQNETNTLIQLVRDKTLDLAIVRLPIDLEDFDCLMLGDEPLYFVTGDAEPGTLTCKHESVSYEAIAGYPLLLPSTEGLGLYNLILEHFRSRGLSPIIIGECSDIGMLIELVSSGFGASILPETSLGRHTGRSLRYSRIDDPYAVSSSAVIWLKQPFLSKAAVNFIGTLRAGAAGSEISAEARLQ
ncbi:LysR family transcriptional regulator [Paenibacillus typhae]|uniref:DNA-binding transcriptional regulator, LysR family n=1 Tax=Paenibacillus typhae TaxID=1174501 RepID=A0A1G8NYX8_9BACL|nr:LysR family transcriptional regulator [Paenibacillus typhae]SDI85216.1 DNA-binding transcriptional regulator, LysR family [Paenibacillus typhae]